MRLAAVQIGPIDFSRAPGHLRRRGLILGTQFFERNLTHILTRRSEQQEPRSAPLVLLLAGLVLLGASLVLVLAGLVLLGAPLVLLLAGLVLLGAPLGAPAGWAGAPGCSSGASAG